MRMAALSRSTGVPVPTIKFYLREGLLQPGRRTSPNQSQYDEEHVHRLSLIRGLTEIGGISLARVADILTAIKNPDLEVHEVFGVVSRESNQHLSERSTTGAEPRYDLIDTIMYERGWQHDYNAEHRLAAATLLAIMDGLRLRPTPFTLQVYADAAQMMAEVDVAAASDRQSRADRLESFASSTILGDALAATLRRMAQTALTANELSEQS